MTKVIMSGKSHSANAECSGQIALPKGLALWNLTVQQLFVPTGSLLLAHFMDDGIKRAHDIIYTGWSL